MVVYRGEIRIVARGKTTQRGRAAAPSPRRQNRRVSEKSEHTSDERPVRWEALGLRERKKARLRQQIVETALKLFRRRGYDNTRIDDIVQVLEVSQPTFFRYFPSKDAVLREIGRRAFARQAESLKSELSSQATTGERLRRFYETLAKVTEEGRPLWQAVILAGAMDPVRSPELRKSEGTAFGLLCEILARGQEGGDVTRAFPVVYLAEFMEGLFNTVVRQWAVDLHGAHKLADRAGSAVEFFLRGAKP
jgi:AcrR family transcriptional regulator